MNRHLLLPAAIIPLFFTGCEKPKPDVSDRLSELEQRLAAAEQEAAEARAAREEAERVLEEQQLAVKRDALERERLQLEQERIDKERMLEEQARAAEEELRQREEAIVQREQSTIALQDTLSEQEKALQQREAELSERDREIAGREALPESTPNPAAAPPEPSVVDVDVFYESLSPYGSWFDSPDYGYVWRPNAYRTTGWRPYTHGRWACTDRGWMWVSDEPFGWATYHYGRWALCRHNGWIWVPGNEWAPSWVAWRSSGSHIGWAPLPPETLAYRGRRWDSSVEITFGIGSSWFSFVEIRHFSSPVRDYCLPYTRNDYYWGRTANITNIYIQNNRIISGGPSYGDIARQTDRRPPFYRIEEDRSGRPGRDRGFQRIDNGRIVVTTPRREESRNRDAVMNRPSRVSGRLDRMEVVRSKPLDQDIVREFKKNREQARASSAPPKQNTQGREESKPGGRSEEQRRLNEKAEQLERDARKNVDDRIRVLPRPAGDRSTVDPKGPKRPEGPPTNRDTRSEEQQRLNEKAEQLERDARKNVDDRIRVLPRPAGDRTTDGKQPQVPKPPPVQKPKTPGVSPRQPENRVPQPPARPSVSPRQDELANQNTARQQRQAEEQRANQRRQQQAEEARRQQQQQLQRQAEAQRENQRRQQLASEEARRQQLQRQSQNTTRKGEPQRQWEEEQQRNVRR